MTLFSPPAPSEPTGGSRLLDGLDDDQRAAVASETHPLCILAGAGSGKTRVLTRRIAHRVQTQSAAAQHVLAVTFTRKAAGELTARLGTLGVGERLAAGTFHSLAYGQLRRRWSDRGESAPALLDRKTRVVYPLMKKHRLPETVQAMDIAAEIEWAKARMIGPDSYQQAADASGRRLPTLPTIVASIYADYEKDKRKRGVVDFDDLLGLCATAIEDDPSFAAAVRHRHRHLFVDEFQDVNPLQFRLLKGWLGDRLDLCVVGDPNQAIYAWNGADPAYLTDFVTHFPRAAVVKLGHNYRSTPPILAAGARVLGRPAPTAHRTGGGAPSVMGYADEKAEARAVARRIKDLRNDSGRPWSGFAVLTRTNAQSVHFEAAFRSAGIPCRIRGGGSFLDLPEIKEAVGRLGRARFDDWVESVAAAAASGGADERRASLETLVGLARDYTADDPRPSAPGFSAYLAANVKADDVPTTRGADAVDLVTFHRAKGLEWPVVFLCGLEKGLVPISHSANDAAAEDEERRLLYVAITRARDELHCSWAEERTLGTRAVRRSPSPWLVNVQSGTAAATGQWRADVARLRDSQRAGSGGAGGAVAGKDEALLTDLRTWRTTVAKGGKVPAYVVFSDATLAAIATARPRGKGALLTVPGVGPVKVERYGDDVLAIVARHVG